MKQHCLTEKELHRFLKYLNEEERSQITIEKYTRDIHTFMKYVDGQRFNKLTVIAYKQHLTDQGYAPRSINSMLAAINSLFKYLEWYDCRVHPLRIQREIYRPEEKDLTRKEFERLCYAAKENGNERLLLILETLCSTGIRIGELKYITLEAVKAGEMIVYCKGKNRKVLLIRELKKKLLNYANKHHIVSGPLFLNSKGQPIHRAVVWREMKKLCQSAKVSPQKVFPHNLRHLFAVLFYKSEKDIAMLADVLGHSSVNTTMIYLISSGKEHMRRLERLKIVT